MKNGLVRLLIRVVGLALLLLVCSCGGSGGGASFGSAGTLDFQKEIVADSAPVDLIDPNSILRVIAPAGTLTPGQKVKIEVWSKQRDQVKLNNFTQSSVAADLIIAPGALGANVIDVEMAGSTTPGTTTILSAFGPDGKFFALPAAAGATSPFVRGQLNAELIAFLAGTTPDSMTPVRVQIVVQNLPSAGPLAPQEAPQTELKTVWTKPPESRTTYASRKRVAVLLSGMLDPAPSRAMISYITSEKRMEGNQDKKADPYDLVTTFTYDWTESLVDVAASLKTRILNDFGDPDKFEVHFYAHGEGGLVCRWAIEKLGIPTAKSLYMFGTPQKGYPQGITNHLLLTFGQRSGTGFIPSIPKLFRGLSALSDGNQLFKDLSTSKPAGSEKYYTISGSRPIAELFGFTLGDRMSLLYRLGGEPDSDGLVGKQSTLYTPAITGQFIDILSLGHYELIDKMDSYFLSTGSTSWIPGLNRQIASFSAEESFVTVLRSFAVDLVVVAKDKDGDVLDPDIVFGVKGPNSQSELQWTSSDTSVVVTPATTKGFKNFARGAKAGQATVTVRDPDSGKSFTFTVKVVDNTYLILPNKPDLKIGEKVVFSATPIQGELPKTAEYYWSVKEGLLRRKGSFGAGSSSISVSNENEVEYLAPNKSVTDKISLFILEIGGGKTLGGGATDINVGAPFRITPNGSVVPSGGYQPFTVEALGTSTLPPGGSYKWSVTGGGTLSSATTTEPKVDYTAPGGQADPTISVDILNADGSKAATVSTTVKVRPGNFRFTAKNMTPYISQELGNGDYNGPLVSIGQGIVGSVYRIGLVFGIDEGPGVNQDTPAWVVFIALSQGTKLQVGQTFPMGAVDRPGVFYAFSVLTPSAGTMKILTADQNSDGTYTYTFSMSLDAFTSLNGVQANVITGSGTFTLSY